MTNKTPKVHAALTSVQDVLASARETLRALEAEAAKLREAALAQVPRARGTREMKALSRELTLAEHVAAILRTDPTDTATLAARLTVPAGRVSAVISKLRGAGSIHNVGSDVEPRWQHVLGDDCTPAELRAVVLRLVQDRPFSHRELCVVTGARENRISGVLADLREDKATRVVNLGTGTRGRWFVLPADLKIARLER